MSLETNSIAVQCNLMDAPPLEKFSKPGGSPDDSFITETEPEQADLDISLHLSQEENTTE